MRNILVTNALPYANGDLHLGHMLGYIQSDIFVRFQKMQGHNCYFVCGSDTHGTPIMLKSKALKIKPEKLVKDMAYKHRNDFLDFEVEFDNYYSTHNEINEKLVKAIYLKIKSKGLIEEKNISQAFDEKNQMFLPDRFVKGTCPKCKAENQYGDSCEVCSVTYDPLDLIDPISVISNEKPIAKDSLHYFFKLNCFADDLYKWINENDSFQKEVKNKLQEWFKSGLFNWDISRDAPYFGYKIPETDNKYFYVWLDAPLGYIASFIDLCNRLDLNYLDYWGQNSNHEIYHFIGKDIIYFHSLFWPAILQAADFKKPTSIFANGFLTINGLKMSKSRGTFIKARDYLEYLDPEYLRYYFASKLNSSITDINLNLEDFVQKVNSDLINKIVNIASRTAKFINKNFDNNLSNDIYDEELLFKFIQENEEIKRLYEKREFSNVVRKVMNLADLANQFIAQKEPWKLIKNDDTIKDAHNICSLALNLFKVLIIYLKPILPSLSKKALNFLNVKNSSWSEVFNVLQNHQINKFKPLLKRIEMEKVNKILKKSL